MKVVINTCFGGFGLSNEAISLLAQSACSHIVRHDPREFYGGREGWEEKFAKDLARDSALIQPVLVIDNKIVTDEHRSDAESRLCPHLVSVVEQMAEKAGGRFSKLRIVEVPDGVEFEIADYDGNEHVAEAHRVWR